MHFGSSKKQFQHINKNASILVLCEKINSNVGASKTFWHRRLGHPSMKILNSLVQDCILTVINNEELKFCESCQFGKAHKLPFILSQSQAINIFYLMYCDLWGPAPITSSPMMDLYITYFLFLLMILAGIVGSILLNKRVEH